MKPPEGMPAELEAQRVDGLVKTLAGFCNESILPRASIIGALETVKHTLLEAWHEESKRDDDEGCFS